MSGVRHRYNNPFAGSAKLDADTNHTGDRGDPPAEKTDVMKDWPMSLDFLGYFGVVFTVSILVWRFITDGDFGEIVKNEEDFSGWLNFLLGTLIAAFIVASVDNANTKKKAYAAIIRAYDSMATAEENFTTSAKKSEMDDVMVSLYTQGVCSEMVRKHENFVRSVNNAIFSTEKDKTCESDEKKTRETQTHGRLNPNFWTEFDSFRSVVGENISILQACNFFPYPSLQTLVIEMIILIITGVVSPFTFTNNYGEYTYIYLFFVSFLYSMVYWSGVVTFKGSYVNGRRVFGGQTWLKAFLADVFAQTSNFPVESLGGQDQK